MSIELRPRLNLDGLPLYERLLVLFGPPGAGKSTIGRALEQDHGYHFYEGDSDLPTNLIELARQGKPFSESLRDEFMQRVTDRAGQLIEIHPKVAIAQAFINDRFRRRFLDSLPFAKFILVDADENTRIQRVLTRPAQIVSAGHIIRVSSQFEIPTIPHIYFKNNS